MKILITGGLGFIGTNLSDYLLDKGHSVIAVGRAATQNRITSDRYHYISADTTRPGDWQKALGDVDAVVNLAGKSIFKRWSKSYKKEIYDSRILTTRNVVDALPAGQAVTLTDKGIRVAVMRFGVILGKGGGALAKMIPAFKFFVGGPIGSGTQWFPWMHLTDLMAAMLFVFEHPQVSGPLNFCAPHPVKNRQLANTLGEVLGRPAIMPAPAFMIRMLLGEFGNVLLDSQHTIPGKLLSHGFEFEYPDIKSALQAVVS